MNIDCFDKDFEDTDGWVHQPPVESRANPSPAPAYDHEPDDGAEHDPWRDPVLGYEDDPELEPAPQPDPDELWLRGDGDGGLAEEPVTSTPPALQAPPEALEGQQAGDQGAGQSKKPKDKVHFVMGPICLEWVVRAMALKKSSKSAIAVGLGLWLEVGLEKDVFLKRGRSESKPIRVNRKFKRRLRITPSQSSRGILALEAAGLIRILKGGAGRCSVVVIRNIQNPRLRAARAVATGSTTNRTPSEAQQPHNQQENSHE